MAQSICRYCAPMQYLQSVSFTSWDVMTERNGWWTFLSIFCFFRLLEHMVCSYRTVLGAISIHLPKVMVKSVQHSHVPFPGQISPFNKVFYNTGLWGPVSCLTPRACGRLQHLGQNDWWGYDLVSKCVPVAVSAWWRWDKGVDSLGSGIRHHCGNSGLQHYLI